MKNNKIKDKKYKSINVAETIKSDFKLVITNSKTSLEDLTTEKSSVNKSTISRKSASGKFATKNIIGIRKKNGDPVGLSPRASVKKRK